MKVFLKYFYDPALCTVFATRSKCQLLPPSCALKLKLACALHSDEPARQEKDGFIHLKFVGQLPF